jgi:nitrate reductase NapE component
MLSSSVPLPEVTEASCGQSRRREGLLVLTLLTLVVAPIMCYAFMGNRG